MKKIAWALCLGLGCLTLAGCSGNSEPFEAKTYTPEGQVQGVQQMCIRDSSWGDRPPTRAATDAKKNAVGR